MHSAFFGRLLDLNSTVLEKHFEIRPWLNIWFGLNVRNKLFETPALKVNL